MYYVYKTKVTLVGTWSRKDTAPDDITMARHALSVYGPPCDIAGYFHTYRAAADSARWDRSTRHGTFRIVVSNVPARMHTTRQRQAISRALQLVRWWLTDHTCRAPKLVVDYDRSFVTTERLVSGQENA